MRRLLPESSVDVDLFDSFAREPTAGRYIRLGMVMSIDGSVTDEEGWTSGLGGSADRRVLGALRAVSDAILVGAGSIRTKRYPPHRPSTEYRMRRQRAGKSEVAPLVVVTRSGHLDWSLPAFSEAQTPTLVLTCEHSGISRDLPRKIKEDVLVHGESEVDFEAGLTDLRERYGLSNILCEGGPGLATQLLASELVDELVLSLAPSILPGVNRRMVENLGRRQELELCEIYEEDGEVFLRYGVRR